MGCVEAWTCTPWVTTSDSDEATRDCTDESACGTTDMRPVLATTLPDLDMDFFQCEVEPILDRGCAQMGCHGVEGERALRVYARGRLRINSPPGSPPEELLAPIPGCPRPLDGPVSPDECNGRTDCHCGVHGHTPAEWRRNYDSARGFGIGAEGGRLTDGRESELLRQPEIGGGFAHAGIHFWRAGDADYDAIRRWLEGATLGRTCDSGN